MRSRFMQICLLLSLSIFSFAQETVDTIYGSCVVTEPVLCALINSDAFNRLKGINQYGIVHYIHEGKVPYTRHTHSLGVFFLLRHYGASLKEQVAGLLHDVSHTVFSHVGDHLKNSAHAVIDQTREAYQDEEHLWLLAQTDIASILAEHGLSLESINHKGGDFAMLEDELPNICADRLEYNLYGAFVEGWLEQEEISEILDALHYEDETWFFDDPVQAKKLADASIRLCTDIFASSYNAGSYSMTAQALMRAVDIKLISYQDILFGTDDAMLAQLLSSDDTMIASYMEKALRAKSIYVASDAQSSDLSYIGKFRGINPWIRVDDCLVRLTECDAEFNARYQAARAYVCARHYYRCVV